MHKHLPRLLKLLSGLVLKEPTVQIPVLVTVLVVAFVAGVAEIGFAEELRVAIFGEHPPQRFQSGLQLAFLFATLLMLVWVILVFLAEVLVTPEPNLYKLATDRIRDDLDRNQRPNARDEASFWLYPVYGLAPAFRLNNQRPKGPNGKPPVILSVVNLKGGVGKTTVTANLAGWLSATRNLRVLVVDLDFQGTLSEYLLNDYQSAIESNATINRAYAPDFTPGDLTNIRIQFPGAPQSWIIPASNMLDYADSALASLLVYEQRECRFLFRSLFHADEILAEHDIILFDCPPRLTASAVNALTSSDLYLIPTLANRPSMAAVKNTIKRLNALGKAGIPMPQLAGIVYNRVGAQSPFKGIAQRAASGMRDEVSELLHGQHGVFTAVIPESNCYANHNSDESPFPTSLPTITNRYNVREGFDPFGEEFLQRIGRG